MPEKVSSGEGVLIDREGERGDVSLEGVCGYWPMRLWIDCFHKAENFATLRGPGFHLPEELEGDGFYFSHELRE